MVREGKSSTPLPELYYRTDGAEPLGFAKDKRKRVREAWHGIAEGIDLA